MMKVLFAHSDPRIVDMYRPHLARHFSVDCEQDGLSALRRIRLSKPGLIVSAFDLPILSGIGLLKFIRANISESIPFIFLAGTENMDQGLSFGANDWLDLTLASPDKLLERIYGQLKVNRYGL